MEFLPLNQGWCGGNCIELTPYYLAQKAKSQDVIQRLFYPDEDGMMKWVSMLLQN